MLEQLFETLRGKRQQAVRSQNEQLEEMSDALANGDEVDVEYLSELLAQLGKTESDLERIVKAIKPRRSQQEELKRLRELAATLPKLEQQRDKALADLEDANRKLRPAVDLALEAIRGIELKIPTIHLLESSLADSCNKQSLIARRDELAAERMAIAQKLRPLDTALQDAVGKASYHRAQADSRIRLKAALRTNDLLGRTTANESIKNAEATADRAEALVKTLRGQANAYKSQIASLEREQSTLRQQMIAS